MKSDREMETEDVLRKNGNSRITKRGNRSSVSVIHNKKQKNIIIEILNKFSYYHLMHLEKEKQGLP